MIFHLPEDLAPLSKKFILVGKRNRAKRIAERYSLELLYDGDFLVYGGEFGVCATGIGPSAVSIAMHELAYLGARVFLRIGTGGGVLAKPGDIVIVSAAVRDDGVTDTIAPPGYPAVASLEVVNALRESLPEALVGVEHTKSEFWKEMPWLSPLNLDDYWISLKRLGVLVSSMESATIFVKKDQLTHLLGERVLAGSVLLVVGKTLTKELYAGDFPEDRIIEGGVEALRKISYP